jgi:hypothetical protein
VRALKDRGLNLGFTWTNPNGKNPEVWAPVPADHSSRHPSTIAGKVQL